MEFFKELEGINTSKMSGLRAGKAAEQAEFDNLLREVEKELDQAASQAPRRRQEDEVLAVAEDGPSDPSMSSASGDASTEPGMTKQRLSNKAAMDLHILLSYNFNISINILITLRKSPKLFNTWLLVTFYLISSYIAPFSYLSGINSFTIFFSGGCC